MWLSAIDECALTDDPPSLVTGHSHSFPIFWAGNIWEYVVLFRAVKSEKEDLCIPKDIFKDLMWYNANGKCLTRKMQFLPTISCKLI